MKSSKDIEALQAEWLEAPHFPLEEVEGFGQHKEVLKQSRLRQEAFWAEERRKADAETRAKVNAKAALLQTSVQVAQHLMWLEARQKELHAVAYASKQACGELHAEVLALKQEIANMKSSTTR